MTDDRLRRVSPRTIDAALDDTASDPTVVGILLAAGGSSRFGDANKLLAGVEDEPLARRAARTLRESCVSNSVAVLGHEAETVRTALDGFGLRFVHNPAYENGLSTSVRAGVGVASEMDADAIVVLPGDMPFVAPETVDLLVAAYRAGEGDAIAAAYDDRRGNPVLFDRRHFASLRSVTGDVGGRRILLESERGVLVATDDPGVVADIDTAEDLERVR